MSQLVKLLREAGRRGNHPAAGFGSRQDSPKKRLVLVAALPGFDAGQARAAGQAGADAIEVQLDSAASRKDELKKLIDEGGLPVGVSVPEPLSGSFDFKSLEGVGLDYVKVEAGDVAASVFLLNGPAVVLEVKESFSDTMLKMLNFLPARAVQVDSPDDIGAFSVRQLMEKRVDRELVGKPLLMKVGASIKPEAAGLLALVAPNGLLVPAADVAAWRDAIVDLKDPNDVDDDASSTISLRAQGPSVAASAAR